jgi:DNA-binding GntR family transcriptional regulator
VEQGNLLADVRISRRSTVGAYQADLEIHRALVAALGSRGLDAVFAGILTELRLAILVEDTLSDFPELVAEHERLVDLIRAGDTAGASTLLKQHLDDAERLLVPAVAD